MDTCVPVPTDFQAGALGRALGTFLRDELSEDHWETTHRASTLCVFGLSFGGFVMKMALSTLV